MSDSEDEAAFASADEGNSPKADEVNRTQKAIKTKTKESGDDKTQHNKPTPAASSSSNTGKQRGKQQKQAQANTKRKGKGKGNSQQTSSSPKDTSSVSSIPEPTPSKDDLNSSGENKPEAGDSKSVTHSVTSTSSAAQPSSCSSNENLDKAEVKSEEQVKIKLSEEKKTKVADGEKTKPAEEEEEKTKQAGDIRRSINDRVSGTTDGKMGEDKTSTTQPLDSDKKTSGGWGWGNWGTSLLSAASNSVQTFTDQVGGGLSTIIDTVESSLGVPDPEELARGDKSKSQSDKDNTSTSQSVTESQPMSVNTPVEDKDHKEGEKKDKDTPKQQENKESSEKPAESSSSWFSSWGVADIAKKVTDTGKTLASKGQTLMTDGFDAVENLASGGIDVLESIGKKTYSTLSEHDPAFKKTREFLWPKNTKPNLSSMIREAKETNEKEAAQKEENEEARLAHFESLFDDYQGIAHLEALEILSNQSEKKVHSLLNTLSSEDLKTIKPVLIGIKQVFELDEMEEASDANEDQDFTNLVSQHLSELELGTAPDKLNKVHDMVRQWMLDFDTHHKSQEQEAPKTIHRQAIQSLAELSSKGVEQFHKAGELVLLQRDSDKDCNERAQSLARLTGVLCHEIGLLANKFAEILNKTAEEQEEKPDVTSLVTSVFLEARNSSTYTQDAFQLLLPVLQQAAIEHYVLSRQS